MQGWRWRKRNGGEAPFEREVKERGRACSWDCHRASSTPGRRAHPCSAIRAFASQARARLGWPAVRARVRVGAKLRVRVRFRVKVRIRVRVRVRARVKVRVRVESESRARLRVRPGSELESGRVRVRVSAARMAYPQPHVQWVREREGSSNITKTSARARHVGYYQLPGVANGTCG